MSTNGQEAEKLNKKQRRKIARTNLQTTHVAEDNVEKNNSTTNPICTKAEPQTNAAAVSIGKDFQESKLNTNERNGETQPSETDINDNDEQRNVPLTLEIETNVDQESNEDSLPPTPSPSPSPSPTQTARRRLRRLQIKSAIPLLPELDFKKGTPAKPTPGTKGTPVQVYCNHFPVKVSKDKMLYQYEALVEKSSVFRPHLWEEAMSRDQRRRFVQQLAEKKLFDFIYWYDEGKCFYSTQLIQSKQLPLIYEMKIEPNHDRFRLTISKCVGQWSTSTIFNYLHQPSNTEPPSCAIRILETLLKQALLPVTHCEGSLFYRDQLEPDVKINDGFELRLGFFQSLCLTQGGLTLNLQTTLTKFYPYMDILDFLAINLRKDIRKFGMTNNDYEKAKIVLRGCKVTTKQSNYTQIYQVRSFSDIPERQTFLFTKEIEENGEKKLEKINYNLVEYFEKEKGIRLELPKLRCLQCYFLHDRHDPKHLPIEVCRIVQWQECERESVHEQRERQNRSIPSPEQRYEDIMKSLKSCQYHEPAHLPLCKEVHLTVDDREMKLIRARILPPPVINNKNAEINMGRINLKGKFVDPKRIESIAFTYFGSQIKPLPAAKKELMQKFFDAFNKMASIFRLGPIRKCQRHAIPISENDQDRETNIQHIRNYFEQRENDQTELVVCVMDSFWNELRPTIKLNGTVHFGVTTQCVMFSKLQEQIDKFKRNPRGSPDRILDNMCENLLRKINFKLQGRNTEVHLPVQLASQNGGSTRNSLGEDFWQFMGADVIHPVCRQEKPSIAAVVGSGDSVCSTSAVRVCKQWPRNGKCAIEAIVDLQQMVTELLEYYREGNQQLPNKIVFYRDGVDDGQFARILNFEIPQIKRAFQEIYGTIPHPLLTFVVVKKRHHTRFFLLDQNNRTANISPGLVVDTDIVHPGQFSFFLNSHKALQGTNRPALYHVLYDENQFTADELQLLTYYLCFTDPRSSTSEAIPSLIHQADLAASNARDLFPEQDTSTNDGFSADALEDPTLGDVITEHLRVHETMRDTPHFG